MNKIIGLSALLLAASLIPAASAQYRDSEFEIGALGLITDYRSVGVSGPGGSADIGPGLGFSGGFVLGQTLSNRFGGEFRYLYFRNDLKLSNGGTKASLNAQAHAIHYDVLYYLSEPDARVRPYVAGGIGMKRYQGIGSEDPFQPLSSIALLTKTSQSMLMGDFGVGVKFRVSRRAVFRVEFRDYITGVPTKVLTPSPGAEVTGDILHQWAPIFGVSWTW